MKKTLLVDVCLSPQLYPSYHQEDTIVVVIDVLRATSAICTAFEFGVEKMIPVATIEEALDYKKQGYKFMSREDIFKQINKILNNILNNT